VWRRIAANPVAPVRKPRQRRVRVVTPLAPSQVETIRAHLLAQRRLRDATLVSVLAYAGLRPGEALAPRWASIRERTLVVERALALGAVKETKTGVTRSVRLLAPLAADLAEWRLASQRPNPDALVFPSRAGREWSDYDWRNWRKRVFRPATRATGLESVRPYDLRHSFVSLLLTEGLSVVEVAKQAGHSPMMTLNTYGHVIEELAGAERRPAEDVIRQARDELVPLTYPQRRRGAKPRKTKSRDLQERPEEPTRGLESRTPFITRVDRGGHRVHASPSRPCRQAEIADSEGQRGAQRNVAVFGWCSDAVPSLASRSGPIPNITSGVPRSAAASPTRDRLLGPPLYEALGVPRRAVR
jgi:Phage integrase family